MVFRLAEQYLIRAEARAKENNISGSQADLNIIRARAGLPNTTATDVNSLISAIIHERQTELFTEWGNRWFDLRRYNLTDLLKTEKPGWIPADTLYPIPLSQLKLNVYLRQNKGY
jgi:hypothetical protein